MWSHLIFYVQAVNIVFDRAANELQPENGQEVDERNSPGGAVEGAALLIEDLCLLGNDKPVKWLKVNSTKSYRYI